MLPVDVFFQDALKSFSAGALPRTFPGRLQRSPDTLVGCIPMPGVVGLQV